jgi:cytidylate kinase
MLKQGFQIAIDGPVAAGKSTVARQVAERLGFVYVDTGAIYRALTLAAQRRGIAVNDEVTMTTLAHEVEIDVRLPNQDEQDGRQSTVTLDGEDVSWQIRKGKVNRDVAIVAALPQVRGVLVPLQQRIARGKDVVMEGRDITYVVLPDADIRIFLDAAEDVRVERYFHGRRAQEKGWSREEVRAWLQERDETDRNRHASPLKQVPGVWVLDTSGMTLEEVVSMIVRRVEELRGEVVSSN